MDAIGGQYIKKCNLLTHYVKDDFCIPYPGRNSTIPYLSSVITPFDKLISDVYIARPSVTFSPFLNAWKTILDPSSEKSEPPGAVKGPTSLSCPVFSNGADALIYGPVTFDAVA